jgi:hypothetical protein
MRESSDISTGPFRGNRSEPTGALYLSSFGAAAGVDSFADKWNALLAAGRFARTHLVRGLKYIASSLRP